MTRLLPLALLLSLGGCFSARDDAGAASFEGGLLGPVPAPARVHESCLDPARP